MLGPDRRWARLLIPLLLVAAVVGFALGIRSPSAPQTRLAAITRSAFIGDVVIEYPASWQRARSVPSLPGLSLSHQIALAPRGRGGSAVLIAGQFSEGQESPLPSSFLASLESPPRAEAVQQPYLQAYRYRDLKLPGPARALELYVLPSESEAATAVACYAEPGQQDELRQCEAIVGHISLSNPAGNGVPPEASYARRLGAAVSALARERDALRARLRSVHTGAESAALAIQLAGRCEAAASSVAALTAPSPAVAAQSALIGALREAAAAYRAFAAGTGGAATQVEHAEAQVNSALEDFALLGYS